ncbi:APC family permease [Granulicella tundricola]|uniref:Putative amino acid transporter n=1 Tax=Granulicella tundricola (strain ATCC BAA-1859 / DSM 23138 / MP5ACTX9) TaxID=1198114 RepID=E8X607_GRATM|nr:APC family permease [Granulicella tundricola]ADW70891.1 putative amino acid transporter [Granulicella tundricola MP5ACTX9]
MTKTALADWLLSDIRLPKGVQGHPEPEHPWWRVMCLTGVDYFSTLGYQPGIAFLAAGFLSPIATFVLVLVTLFAALPLYSRVAEVSPNGQGSIAMLERLFPQWGGKVFVLVLLGFASTDFIITMTLSAADAAAHFIHNPFAPHWLTSQMLVTLLLLAGLSAIFLKGFKEAIGIAVVLVGAYLFLNAIVTVVAFNVLFHHPEAFPRWKSAVHEHHPNILGMIGLSLLLFPKLALGLSGFETGVAVMPLIAGKDLQDRIHNTRKLLATAAIIMSVFLMATSIVTTMLIPRAAFAEGGEASGRAMAYLAHQYLGNGFGTVYDISTILILAFAGASAMAGLLNLIPRYLPRFGMAPEWALASRPLVLVFMTTAVFVTIAFHADVNAQGGAYATGVLVLITSAAVAVTIHVWKKPLLRFAFAAITVIFIYTTALNIYERPEGLKISSFFILAIITTSVVSRAMRSTELRISEVELLPEAVSMLAEDEDQVIRLIARSPKEEEDKHCADELDALDAFVRTRYGMTPTECLYFLEIERIDASEFEHCLCIEARRVGRHRILCANSPVVANSIAALLMHLEETTGKLPHAYFKWKEGNPVVNIIRFIFLGEGDTAPLTHEVLRRAVPNPDRRPIIHVS